MLTGAWGIPIGSLPLSFEGFMNVIGSKGPLEGRPKLAAWWARIQERPSTKKAIGEQQAALAAMMKK